jgi:hypothetical protein
MTIGGVTLTNHDANDDEKGVRIHTIIVPNISNINNRRVRGSSYFFQYHRLHGLKRLEMNGSHHQTKLYYYRNGGGPKTKTKILMKTERYKTHHRKLNNTRTQSFPSTNGDVYTLIVQDNAHWRHIGTW